MRSFLLLLAVFSSFSLNAQQILPENWDPVAQGNTVLDRLVKVTAPEVKGAHDAEFVMVGDYAYIVAEVNDLKAGESGNWTFIYSAMSIVNLKTMDVEEIIPFARSEQQFANVSLPEGQCWIPRIIQKDKKTLRIYFVNERSGDNPHSQVWYIDYNLRSGSFSKKVYKVKIKTAAGKLDFTTENFYRDAKAHGFNKMPVGYGAYLFDSFKEFDGKTYITLNNFPGKQNALAVANKKLDTFEVLGHFNEPQSANLSESSVNRLPDGTWMAICRRDEGDRNYYISYSKDGHDWTIGKPIPSIPNGTSSKPTFDYFDGIYYLGWQEASQVDGVSRSVFNIDVSRDGKEWERKYSFRTTKSFQYPSFAKHDNSIWLITTQGDFSASRKERIMFGKLE
ncbi:sialidase family protein [Cyclobacterium sp. 1_MG-2023]|uniref:sialidase family protein n=1 Tax=Cyclobacterium sp. 1_MG-2023 TaxID=3062681 RepID=UPI0026E4009A|nr:sialidase family protein [Cyclobacterium sp. 1_MG-2023]MDO6436513.1 sialidase family protein [Cyclobacterium sp. 1_MG-2023]